MGLMFQVVRDCAFLLLFSSLIFISEKVNAQGIVCGMQAPFPDTWNPPPGPPPAWMALAKERVERIRSVRNKLGNEINVNFDKTPWRQALSKLATKAEITINVDEAKIAEARVVSNVPANVSTTASLREFLHLLLEPNNLMFAVHEWGVEVTTAEHANEQRLTCMIDMSAFLPDSSNSTEFVTVITQQIDHDVWYGAGGTSQLSLFGSMLVVTATDSTIANIEHFCSQIAQHQMRNLSFTPPAIPSSVAPAAFEITPQAAVPWDAPAKWEAPAIPQPAWLQSGKDRQQRIETVRNKLSSQITADFKRTPWREAIVHLASTANLELRFNDSQIAEVEPIDPVLLEPTASLRSVLEAILEKNGLAWIVHEGFVEITIASDANAKRLTQVIDMSLFLPDAWNSTLLIELIPLHINPEEWLKAGGQSTNSRFGSLMVTIASDATLAQIEEFCVQIAEQPKRNLSAEFDPVRRFAKP